MKTGLIRILINECYSLLKLNKSVVSINDYEETLEGKSQADYSDLYRAIMALPALAVGESCTVYWVWAIPEEDLPYLFVGLNNDRDNFGVGGLDEEALEMGLVDIRQE